MLQDVSTNSTEGGVLQWEDVASDPKTKVYVYYRILDEPV